MDCLHSTFRQHGLEGVIAKQRRSTYRPGDRYGGEEFRGRHVERFGVTDRVPERRNQPRAIARGAVQAVGIVIPCRREGVGQKRKRRSCAPRRRSSADSGDWVKLRANRGQELVIGGYVPSSNTFDSILVGYYAGASLK